MALYGFDTEAKRSLLAILSSKLGAVHVAPSQGGAILIGDTTRNVTLPPPIFDPLGSYTHPTWDVREMRILEAITWWMDRADMVSSTTSYFSQLIAMGLMGEPLSVEYLERDLHPRYLSTMTDFLVSLVKNGQRVVFETHSLQVFDRLRMWDAWDSYLQGKFGVWVVDETGGTPVELHSDAHYPRAMTDESLDDEVRIGQLRRGES